MCLWIQVHPLVDSRVEEVSYVDSASNLHVDQGLWIQVSILHLSCAKAALVSRQILYKKGSLPCSSLSQYIILHFHIV